MIRQRMALVLMVLSLSVVVSACMKGTSVKPLPSSANTTFVTATPSPPIPPTLTGTPSATPTQTSTVTPTDTATLTPTSTSTSTPTATSTSTPSPTNTPDTDLPAAPHPLTPREGTIIECNPEQSVISVKFEWTDVSDASGIIAYEIVIAGQVRTRNDNSTFLEIDVSCGNPYTQWQNSYTWKVRAIDGAGNKGPYSLEHNFYTLVPDTAPPSLPPLVSPGNQVRFTCSHNQFLDIAFEWGPSRDTRSGISGYSLGVFRWNQDSWEMIEETEFIAVQKYTLTLPCDYSYAWTVRARDGKGNTSDWHAFRYFSVELDRIPPSVPIPFFPENRRSLICRSYENSRPVDLKWFAAQDPSGISRYEVILVQQRGDNDWPEFRPRFSSKETVYNVRGLSCKENYAWRVRAIDSQGNIGEWSNWHYFRLEYETVNITVN